MSLGRAIQHSQEYFLHFEMNVTGYCFAEESVLFAASLKINSQHSL
jgi:hypothetical protein